MRRVTRWNARHEVRKPMSDEARQALVPEVTREVEQLRELLGPDLSDWLRSVQVPGWGAAASG